MNAKVLWLTASLTVMAGACSTASNTAPLNAATGSEWPHGAMASAANPHAVDAAMRVLAAGGHAVDAAIAAHTVLGLVEPQSSGIGGGGFMLVYERDSDRTTVYDGRETAPAGASSDIFLGDDGKAVNFLTAWQSGTAVGVPGAVALYKTAHDRHGRRPWASNFEPAIELATAGFAVSPRLNNMLKRVARFSLLDEHPASAAYFYPGGEALPVGFRRANPEYATTLTRIASEGPSAFYRGALAEAIAAAAQAQPHGGSLSVDDLAAYETVVREPICGAFRVYKICSAPPPSSGVAQIMIAGLYERLASAADSDPLERMRFFVDAQRLAYADRDHYIADPAFSPDMSAALIVPAYLDARSRQRIAPDGKSAPGDPSLSVPAAAGVSDFGRDATGGSPSTTHLSIIDADGNAVTMTATVEAAFGSSRFVGGFLLNNQLTDFARQPRDAAGTLLANAPAPGKRPRSSMSPTLVFAADGELVMATGSPGGNSIVAYVAKSILGVLAWDMAVQDAINLPNVIARGDRVRVEVADEHGQAIAKALSADGYDVQEREGENSGLHAIVVGDDGLTGGADPRREGIVKTLP